MIPVVLNQSSVLPPASLVGNFSYHHHQNQSARQENLEPAGLARIGCESNNDEQLYVTLSTFWYLFLALITAAGLLISLVSNMIIIYLVSSTRSLRRNPSNIIAANLSFSDLLYCIQWPSVIYTSVTQSTSFLEQAYVCQTLGFITVSTALASILTVLAMSVERAVVIRYSIQAKNRFTIRLAWLVTFIIWLISLTASFPPLLGKFNRYTLDPSKTSCTLDYLSHHTNYKLYILFLYVTFWIVPFVMITISYALIISTFKKSSLSLEKVNACRVPAQDQRQAVLRQPCRLIRTDCWHRYLRDSIRNSLVRWRLDSVGSKRMSCQERLNHAGRTRALLAELTRCGPVDRSAGGRLRRVASSSNFSAASLVAAKLNQNNQSSFAFTNLGVSRASQEDQIERSVAKHALSKQTSKLPEILRSETFHGLPMRDFGAIQHSPAHLSSQLSAGRRDSNNFQTVRCNSHLNRPMLQFRLARMSFYLILLWLVSWTPIASLAMINSVMSCHRASITAVFMASTMTKLGPTFDVFIYGVSHPKIKSKFKQIIKWLFTFGARATELPDLDLDCSRASTCARMLLTRQTSVKSRV